MPPPEHAINPIGIVSAPSSAYAQVAAEGNAYLHPMYRVQNARRHIYLRTHGEQRGIDYRVEAKPRRLVVKGDTPTLRAYAEALAWWQTVLQDGISVPLAPRREFPSLNEVGSAFLFTDAAREEGAGYGGLALACEGDDTRALVMYERWDEHTAALLRTDEFSMPAGEAYGAVTLAHAVLKAWQWVTHLVVFTDSDATARMLTTASSAAPQLECIVRWLCRQHASTQLLGVHIPGVSNTAADKLSRGAQAEVLEDLMRAHVHIQRVRPGVPEQSLLLAATAQPRRRY